MARLRFVLSVFVVSQLLLSSAGTAVQACENADQKPVAPVAATVATEPDRRPSSPEQPKSDEGRHESSFARARYLVE